MHPFLAVGFVHDNKKHLEDKEEQNDTKEPEDGLCQRRAVEDHRGGSSEHQK